MATQEIERTGLEIAIIGMAGKFPGANTLARFWENLAQGVESIAHFTDDELREQGIDEATLQRANYVKARGFIEDVEYFDAAFFNYSVREAEMIDPQIRILQECAWEALENAGYAPQSYQGKIGLFAGAATNFQWMEHTPLGQGAQGAAFAEAATLSYKDALSTLTSYKLGLKGPSLTLYTACSTSLLGIHLACRSLLTGECDLSLAGGVSISYPKKKGYLYEVGMTSSPDGRVRPFDADARGAVFSDGAGIVALKRLEDAEQDGDYIYAIIKGSAVNNDGSRKVGYTAPSLEGQSEVITAAQSLAEVEPDTISYIETHGTATPLGDTIEFSALKRAFQTRKRGYCAIGSVKSNVGHLDTAAGVAGLIKTVLALQHQQIPPSLHFDRPNPEIDLIDSPFYVNTELMEWDSLTPRRAGVSAFGYGGTNVHVILEEAPIPARSTPEQKQRVLTISARTPAALKVMNQNLVQHLQANPMISLADVAYTLHVGREQFPYRQAIVCANVEEAVAALTGQLGDAVLQTGSARHGKEQPDVLFHVGAGTIQYATVLQGLYESSLALREEIEQCFAVSTSLTGKRMRVDAGESTHSLADPIQSFVSQFTCEYICVRMLITCGVKPVALLATGLSHIVAACLAGVFTVEHALRWGIASAQLSADPANSLLKQRFDSIVYETPLTRPSLPILSETTGTVLADHDVLSASFWARLLHQMPLVHPQTGSHWPNAVIIQIGEKDGPESDSQQRNDDAVIPLFLREQDTAAMAETSFLNLLASLWTMGTAINWQQLYQGEKRSRLPLPTYPFEKQRFWIDPPRQKVQHQSGQIEKRPNMAEWFYTPAWREGARSAATLSPATWVVLMDHEQVGEQFVEHLHRSGHHVIIVRQGAAFAEVSSNEFVICATRQEDYDRVFSKVVRTHPPLLRIVHLWTATSQPVAEERLLDLGLYALLHLTRALARQDVRLRVELNVLSNQIYQVNATETTVAVKSTLLAPLKVIPQEHTNVKCRCIDFPLDTSIEPQILTALVAETSQEISETEVVYRGPQRLVRTYEPLPAEQVRPALALAPDQAVPPLREEGVYVITGGLGGVGIKLATYLARAVRARIALISREGLPPIDERQTWLETHDEEDRVSFRIRQIQELEAQGARVLVIAADVADEEKMSQALEQIEATFGSIHGLIHAAGILRVHSALCPIISIGREECEEQFRPKMQGVKVLEKVLAHRHLDFCVLVSSLSPILGGLGFVAYAAANLYLDGFVAQYAGTTTTRWLVVNWGDWLYTGPKMQKRIAQSSLDVLEMTNEEAIKTFQCILSLENIDQIVVSSGDLHTRIEQWIHLKALEPQPNVQIASPSASQRRSLLQLAQSSNSQEQFEQIIVDLWLDFYRVQEVDRHKNFFELGATSLDIIQIHTKLVNFLQYHVPIDVMFNNPTIAQLAVALSEQERPAQESETEQPEQRSDVIGTPGYHEGVAVIGMAGRFPGAATIDEFWHNLVDGVGSIRFFTDEELQEAGIPVEDLHQPNYRKAKGYLEGTEYFDAAFFDYTHRDALLMDPQLRVFHECAWSAIEHAGYSINDYKGKVGVFAGASPNLYWQVQSLLGEENEPSDQFLTSLLNDKDSLSTQISYKLNLNGPSVNLFSGCSTSLVAVDAACNALASGQCDMALAGGITLALPEKTGYIYQEGMLFSEDGYCRAFDANATGMVFGDGVGVVVLKPLTQALRDGDTVHAVIKGAAINNDGHRKVGYTAPSVEGQFEVITAALQKARVEPESIGYIETHGTATQLGDVIEMAALKKVFATCEPQSRPLGSVKTNVGHLNAASGVAGFIKTVLSLKHRLIPPSLHFETPNPQIDFAHNPFYVNTTVQPWQNERYPLRAGVSSFGIGGTNAHVILEEAPVQEPSSRERDWKLLLLSAKSQESLERMTDNLVEDLRKHPEKSLADVAYTLQVGRQGFEYRRGLVCRTQQEAIDLFSSRSPQLRSDLSTNGKHSIVFLFPGNGAHYVAMGRELYEQEAFFRHELETCFDILRTDAGIDVKPILYPGADADSAQCKQAMASMEYSQPIIFCLEYALAQLLMHWGIQPSAMIGYSFGEYVAACLAGVFSLQDALRLVATRGKLMSGLPEGAMLSVPVPEAHMHTLLQEIQALHEQNSASEVKTLTIAIDNGASCIVAGTPQAVTDLDRFLRTKRLLSIRVASTIAAHSAQLEGVVHQFEAQLQRMTLHPPYAPFISGLTGTWITAEQCQDPHYWVNHMKDTIRFANGIQELLKDDRRIFVEVGPGRDLSVLLQRFFAEGQPQRIQNTLRPEGYPAADSQFLLEKIAALWMYGISIDWSAFYEQEQRQRIPLPTYAFERISYRRNENPFALGQHLAARAQRIDDIRKHPDCSEWFYVPRWRSDVLQPAAAVATGQTYLVFMDDTGVAAFLVKELRTDLTSVITVEHGKSFERVSNDTYRINLTDRKHYQRLIEELHAQQLFPTRIVHCASLSRERLMADAIHAELSAGFYSFVFMLQAVIGRAIAVDIRVITHGTQHVIGTEQLVPAHATLLGPSLVIAQEMPSITSSVIDITLPAHHGPQTHKLYKQLLLELQSSAPESIIAYRGGQRWVRDYQPLKLEKPAPEAIQLRQGGVYLITGGFGGIGKILARHLASAFQAKIVLVARSAFPERQQWAQLLTDDGSDIAKRIQFVQELEERGAEVLVCQADVADRQKMAEAIERTEQRFGALNGVIHGAGLLGDETFKLLTELEASDGDKQFQAKVFGVLVLQELLSDKQVDFCLLMSSIASVLGGLGYAAYTAANVFMDIFVHQQAQQSYLPWRVVNWSDWKYWEEDETHSVIGKSVHQLSMSPEEGIEAFERVLASEERQIIHSPGQLDLRIDQWVKLQSVHSDEDDPSTVQLHPRPHLPTPYVAPENEVEKALARIWSTVFRVEQIGIMDDFFDLSGDSLKGVTVVSKIHKDLHVDVSISQLFLTPTIAGLADYVQNAQQHKLYSIPLAPTSAQYRLSSGQKRLYILQQLYPESTAYNDVMAYTLEGELDIVRFEEVFQHLLERHESFRTSFDIQDGEPVQTIHPSIPFTLLYQETTEEAARTIVTQFVAPFDLRTAPLLRVGLLKIGPKRHILIFDIHHIITDGVSYDTLVRDFIALYQGNTLPALKLHYKDYAEWQYSEQARALVAKQEAYWYQKFADHIPTLQLATDYPRPAIHSFAGDSVKFDLGRALTEQLKQVAAANDSTIYMYLLSVFAIVLFKYSGQNDIVIGSPVAGRTHPDLQDIIGMFVNMLPMRTFPDESKTFADYVREVQQLALEAFEHEQYQYEELIAKLGLQGSVSANPLFSVVFVLQNMNTERLSIRDLQIELYEFLPRRAQFDLLLSAVEIDENVVMNFEYATALFKRETIEKMASRYKAMLEEVLTTPDIQLGAINMAHSFQILEKDTRSLANEEFAF
ncbi:SDR family NAD(P)-dependent oxidoreductase [Tengunoibacter tsumagoiensis]